eukprot:9802833-Alexandrium_andersonii.AAC.1
MSASLVGSEMCIRDRHVRALTGGQWRQEQLRACASQQEASGSSASQGAWSCATDALHARAGRTHALQHHESLGAGEQTAHDAQPCRRRRKGIALAG